MRSQMIVDFEKENVLLRLRAEHATLTANIEGESTALYIQKMMEDAGLGEVKLTRLARGLPTGVDLAYADQITLSHAFDGRKEF